ncbi:sigma-70 family RNA polymerase sigma factor [Streptomyces albus subsp. chlorinus]|uniref:sigma-70 family RNA polymerase sigma factor n=1 Tax=Streptomyces albus TaxID=1888 RepID=UPI00156EF880|nr:sigma-70 family RNA polymerase sigma factor [Streptomyces albus]NSC19829.1 sigma-70 family RNA polymerase sigma factor [Streptomyces albus subsp. chlorinus]
MTEDAHTTAAAFSKTAPGVLPRPMPLEFEALWVANQEDFHQYARLVSGSWQAAEETVHRAFLEILNLWDELLHSRNMQAEIWAIFRKTVVSQELNAFREGLSRLEPEEEIGLYRALRKLPPRQFDAIILKQVMNLETDKIAWYLGVTTRTVDYHCRKAKERLEQAVPSYLKAEGDSK